MNNASFSINHKRHIKLVVDKSVAAATEEYLSRFNCTYRRTETKFGIAFVCTQYPERVLCSLIKRFTGYNTLEATAPQPEQPIAAPTVADTNQEEQAHADQIMEELGIAIEAAFAEDENKEAPPVPAPTPAPKPSTSPSAINKLRRELRGKNHSHLAAIAVYYGINPDKFKPLGLNAKVAELLPLVAKDIDRYKEILHQIAHPSKAGKKAA